MRLSARGIAHRRQYMYILGTRLKPRFQATLPWNEAMSTNKMK